MSSSSSSGSGSGSSSGGGACGASGEPCCNGAACDNGLACNGGTCINDEGGSDGGNDGGSDAWSDTGSNEGDGGCNGAIDDGGDASLVLATGIGSPGLIAADPTYVEWVTLGSPGYVLRVPAGGGQLPTTLASSSGIGGIARDSVAGVVFWTDQSNGTVMSVPVSGGSATTIASGQSGPIGVAVENANLYWLNIGPNPTVMTVPVAGGSPSTVASSANNGPIASSHLLTVDSNNVYWEPNGPGAGAVLQAPLGGGTVTTLYQGTTFTQGIALDSSYVYWSAQGTGGIGSGVVLKAHKGGGPVITVASGLQDPRDIAVDPTGGNAYWVDNTAQVVMRCATSGCGSSPTTLASAQGSPGGIAVDECGVYWTSASCSGCFSVVAHAK